jgi:hypothetical protein
VHENVLAAIIANDEAEALLCVEELYDASRFADNLGGHSAATAAAAAETTAAAAAEAAATTAAIATATAAAIAATTAAEAAAITTEAAAAAEATAAEAAAITTAKAATAAFVAKTVALVSAAPAAIPTAPSIKTHALFVFPVRPYSIKTQAPDEKRRCSRTKNSATESAIAQNHTARDQKST